MERLSRGYRPTKVLGICQNATAGIVGDCSFASVDSRGPIKNRFGVTGFPNHRGDDVMSRMDCAVTGGDDSTSQRCWFESLLNSSRDDPFNRLAHPVGAGCSTKQNKRS